MLEAIKYIDTVLTFDTRKELEDLVQLYNPDILLLGDDWRVWGGRKQSLLRKLDSFQEWVVMPVAVLLVRFITYESIINWR